MISVLFTFFAFSNQSYKFFKKSFFLISLILLLTLNASTAYSEDNLTIVDKSSQDKTANYRETLMNDAARLGIPTLKGKEENLRTACAARELALGIFPKRLSLTEQELLELTNVTLLKTPDSAVEGVNVSVACQIGYYVREGSIIRIFPVSTGAKGLRTGIGTFKVGWRVDGWRESRQYPGSMLYRPMFFNGGEAIHGLTSDSAVRVYPASHGCVRTRRADVDWIWKHWDKKDAVRVYGTWR